MQSRKKLLKKIIICSSVVILLVLGAIWQFIMVQIEQKNYPAIGTYIDVGKYQAHYYAKGEGDVAFVFITGSGTPCAYTDFYMLQNMLSTMGQTVTIKS